eukprot:NODE_417_length_2519_cov_285.851419_g396_i0.p1 GENE.NODE_417_length_2519_cov_285.851419_g396_i0~~NODE_417_length_2519_cov_285.851419_g396_i0.p1  ORF type:complete len:776 (-),score=198.26 NODE_417_length_2519_cov_285.851419_g396_i0:139-2466(-)
MWKLLLICLCLGSTEAIRITDVEGYPIDWLRAPAPGTPAPAESWRPTPTPAYPLSMRVIYRRFQFTTADDDTLVIGGNGFVGGTVNAKLIAPDSADCTAAPLGAANLVTRYAQTSAFRRHFILPVTTEYPHEHLMPWLCVCSGNQCGLNGIGWIHTNMRYAVVPGCDGDSATVKAADNVLTTNLCENIATSATPTVAFGETNVFPRRVTPASLTVAEYWAIAKGDATSVDNGHRLFLERQSRTKCCGYRAIGSTDIRNNALNKRMGICINPLLENCCSRNGGITGSQGLQAGDGGVGKPYSKFREKCCYGGNATFDAQSTTNTRTAPEPTIISYLDDFCPCQQGRPTQFCNQQKPAPPTGATTQMCCTKTKYPELLVTPQTALEATWGKCYDGVTMKCCDTGDLYDPGSKTCCAINGVQSIDKPCPCSADSHCNTTFQKCCQDVSRVITPTPQEPTALCNIYVNFPNGTGPAELQPCTGHCIDTRFQICCNGMSCIDEYEVCCNNTCCNKFNQRCTMGIQPGSINSKFNRRWFKIPYEVCTSIEGLTPFVAIQVYFLPLFLLAATYISLAATLFFAKRQSTLQPLSTYEKSMFTLCCAAILFAWPLYFSPLYKYGVVAVWACFFVMLASLSQLRQLNIAALFVVAILLVYLIDPFHGNEILTLAEDREAAAVNGVHGFSGVLSALVMEVSNGQSRCIAWYNFFQRDPRTEDQMRWDNPHKTSFGFCSRGWYVALSLFSGILIVLVFLLFFVTLVTHIRNILFEKAQKTDDIVGWH